MKQVFIRQGRVATMEVPAPLVGNGNVLVEVAYSLISTGTELSGLEKSRESLLKKALAQPEKIHQLWDHLKSEGIPKTIHMLRSKIDQPIPTGYSCSGVVIQTGEGVTDVHPGDRVACAGAGLANHAEIVLIPRQLLVKLPDDCSLKDAASVTLGAIAMQGVRRADPRLGEIVAVIGLGLIGQITVQLLKAAGCQIIGLDLDPQRVDLARQHGADAAFSPREYDACNEVKHLTANHGADATVITAASENDEIIQLSMNLTRKKGRVVIVGAVGLGLKRSPFYEKEIDLLISCSYGPGRYDPHYESEGADYPYPYVRWTENRNMQEYLRLIACRQIKTDLILGEEFELDQVGAAFEALSAPGQKPLGIILRYSAEIQDSAEAKRKPTAMRNPTPVSGKIGVAVIGAGSFAKGMHLPNLKTLAEYYHVRAIADVAGDNAKTVADQFGADYATTSYEEVLADKKVDMVLIATRHHLHARMALLAAQAQKAILVEKPMALDEKDLDCLTICLRDGKVPFLVGFNRRFSPAAQRIKALVEKRCNPIVMVYRVNAGYLPPDHWTQTAEGGGRLIGEACHMLDLFRYWVGPSPVAETAVTALQPKTEHVLSGDNFSITIRYEDGSIGTLVYTSLGSPELKKEYAEVYVDGKVLVIDDYLSLRVHGAKRQGWTSAVRDKGHRVELEAFGRYVRGEGPAPIPLEDLVETSLLTLNLARGLR